MFKQRWIAYFRDGHVIEQSDDDRYSKYDESLMHNPSSYQDVLDYLKNHKLLHFDLVGKDRNGDDVINRVLFDDDGDSYISLANGDVIMHSYKLRSANLIYYRNHSKNLLTGEDNITSYVIGCKDNDVCNHIYEIKAFINEYGECIGDSRMMVGVWTKHGEINI